MTQLKLILALVVMACIAGAYFYGRIDGSAALKNNALLTYQKGVEKNANIDRQANRMGESDLDRALSNWVQ